MFKGLCQFPLTDLQWNTNDRDLYVLCLYYLMPVYILNTTTIVKHHILSSSLWSHVFALNISTEPHTRNIHGVIALVVSVC